MARLITTKNKKAGSTKITTREEIVDKATKETTTSSNLNGNHSRLEPCNPCNPGNLPNSLNNDRTEVKTEAKGAKENGADPEEIETSIHIVTRTEGTEGIEDTGATGNGGVPKGTPPCPRSARSQTIAQLLAK